MSPECITRKSASPRRNGTKILGRGPVATTFTLKGGLASKRFTISSHRPVMVMPPMTQARTRCGAEGSGCFGVPGPAAIADRAPPGSRIIPIRTAAGAGFIRMLVSPVMKCLLCLFGNERVGRQSALRSSGSGTLFFEPYDEKDCMASQFFLFQESPPRAFQKNFR